jgi:ParB family chromosome partitioning protein
MIRRNPRQPRKVFDETALGSLVESIRSKGTLQPIVVRPADGGYELIAGERRLRAATAAGLAEIPAIVRAAGDDEMLELALIENLQRQDLNPVERAKAYRQMRDLYSCTDEIVAQRTGEDRATVANYIRLLTLPADVLDLVESGQLSAGHAKAITNIEDKQSLINISLRAAKEGWSVRQIEAAAAQAKAGKGPGAAKRETRPAVRDLEERLTNALATPVTIQEGRRRHTGRIVIQFRALEDFERIVAKLGLKPEEA